MNIKRRIMLKKTLAGSAIAVAASAGLLAPRAVLASFPVDAFKAKSVEDAMKAAFGSDDSSESSDITLKAPDIAENGAVVPITITTSLENIESISIIAAKNSTPLIASHQMGAGTKGYVSTRIKMGKSSDVIAVVKAGGKLYTSKKEVKVTIGGCGG
ncbi:MAG: thiosulfate oxidation carrier protein SoxY [Gammaproteobacteria bacterium]|nr:thiosulfate oxidation carrier protein SoxY [Gammaproteobacteria bacterium]